MQDDQLTARGIHPLPLKGELPYEELEKSLSFFSTGCGVTHAEGHASDARGQFGEIGFACKSFSYCLSSFRKYSVVVTMNTGK